MRDIAVPVPGGEINVWHRPPSPGAPSNVLVHGLTGNSRWFSRVIEHLPSETGIIALDVRGRGDSVDAPPPFDLGTVADDISRCLNHLEVPRAVVAGYSMGAWVAAIFGHRHPDRAERVIMIDGGLQMSSDVTDPDLFIESVVGPSLARLEIDFPDRESFFDYWRAHPALKRYWEDRMEEALGHELVEDEGGLRLKINPESVRVSAHQITVDSDTRDSGASVGVRSHLVVVERGTSDQPGGMIPLEKANEAAAANPNLTIEYLPDLNHYTLVLGRGARAVASAITPG